MSWRENIKCSEILSWSQEWSYLIVLQLKVSKVSMRVPPKAYHKFSHLPSVGLKNLVKSHTTNSSKWQPSRENRWRWCWTIVWKRSSNFWQHKLILKEQWQSYETNWSQEIKMNKSMSMHWGSIDKKCKYWQEVLKTVRENVILWDRSQRIRFIP